MASAAAYACFSRLVIGRDQKELFPGNEVKYADKRVEDCRLDDLAPGNRQDVSHEHVFEMFCTFWCFAHGEDRGSCRNRIDDSDDRLLRNSCMLPMETGESKDGRTNHREAE